MRLPMVPLASRDGRDLGCAGCSRRAVLRGLAAAAATVLAGCPDGSISGDAGPDPSTTMCGDDLCLDLDDPRNAALTSVDGSLIVTAPRDRILVVRTSPTAALAVSDICTHASCGVRYDRVNRVFICPCHGSKYALSGAVLQGPAIRPLAKYQSQLDLGAHRLTIFL